MKIETKMEIEQWDALLHDFEAVSSVPDSESEFKELLKGFDFNEKMLQLDGKHESEFEELLKGFDRVHTAWQNDQKSSADGFNILKTLGVTRKEICHSDVLAWLLDHRIDGYGTHCQGSLGFNLFLKELNLPSEYAATNYRVIRELRGKNSRLDIVIEADGQFIIAIENKVDSKEGKDDTRDDQTKREWADLQTRKKTLKPNVKLTALFLTPGQTKPSSEFFKQISWRPIANVFQAFADQPIPDIVKVFARHYAETLRSEVVSETEIEDTDTK